MKLLKRTLAENQFVLGTPSLREGDLASLSQHGFASVPSVIRKCPRAHISHATHGLFANRSSALISTCLCVAAAFLVVYIFGSGRVAMGQDRPVVLLTGYWPPTNNMVRAFSPTHALPGGAIGSGWIGRNWEGRGFDVVSYFPEFPGQTGPNWGRGSGWLEVDYQDTANDFDEITSLHKPSAIITFSRGNTNVGWELEPATQRFRLPGEANPAGRNIPIYAADFSTSASGQQLPTNVPIVTEPVGNIRNSTLPMQQIVTSVRQQLTSAQADAFIAPYNPATPDTFDFGGNYLSGYIGYLGSWYQSRNAPGTGIHPCYASGHIHIGTNMTAANAELATRISLATLISHVSTLGPIPSPGTLGVGGLALVALMARPRRTLSAEGKREQ